MVEAPPPEDYATCPCGSAWFRLDVPPGEDAQPGPAISMDQEGNITSYAGVPFCTECGQEWYPNLGLDVQLAPPQLRLV